MSNMEQAMRQLAAEMTGKELSEVPVDRRKLLRRRDQHPRGDHRSHRRSKKGRGRRIYHRICHGRDMRHGNRSPDHKPQGCRHNGLKEERYEFTGNDCEAA